MSIEQVTPPRFNCFCDRCGKQQSDITLEEANAAGWTNGRLTRLGNAVALCADCNRALDDWIGTGGGKQ